MAIPGKATQVAAHIWECVVRPLAGAQSDDLPIHIAAAAGHVEACVALAAFTRPIGCLSHVSLADSRSSVHSGCESVACMPPGLFARVHPALPPQTSKKSAYDTLVDEVGEDRAKPLKDAEEAAAAAPDTDWLDEFNDAANKLEERVKRLEDIFGKL